MAYTNHINTIVEALRSLLLGEFKVKIDYSMFFNPGFGHNEYIRYFIDSEDYVSSNTDGEVRNYTFGIDYYFNTAEIDRTKFSKIISKRIEQLKQLLMYNRTYQPNSVYTWHDARIETIEIGALEDNEGYEKVHFIHCDFTVTRFNKWVM